MLPRNKAAVVLRALHKGVYIGLAQDSPRRVDADAIVRGEKVEERHPIGRQAQPGGPVSQVFGIPRSNRVQDQWRQREVIDELRLIGTVAEVRQVLRMR